MAAVTASFTASYISIATTPQYTVLLTDDMMKYYLRHKALSFALHSRERSV